MLCCLGPAPVQLDECGHAVVEAGGRTLCLIRRGPGRRIVAVELTCSHQGARLGAEHISDSLIATCPRHGWAFDLRSGRCRSRPDEAPLPTYDVHAQGGELWVDLPKGYLPARRAA